MRGTLRRWGFGTGVAVAILPPLVRAWSPSSGLAWSYGTPAAALAAVGWALVFGVGFALFASWSGRAGLRRSLAAGLVVGPVLVALAGMAEDLSYGMAPTLFRPGLMAHHFHVFEIARLGPVLGLGLPLGVALLLRIAGPAPRGARAGT